MNFMDLGSEVHVDIFDDRMEIYSPGGMYDGSFIQNVDIDNVPSRRRNPVIADVFNRLDYMERRGSGFRKIKNAYEAEINYTENKTPVFFSNRTEFRVTLMNLNYTPQDTPQDDKTGKILEFCKEGKSLIEIMEFCQMKDKKYFRDKVLNPLLERGLLSRTIPDRPTNRNQKYISSKMW